MSTRVRNPDTERGKTGKRSAPRRRRTREQREGKGGRVREKGDVVCLKALNENLGMAAGGTLRSTKVVV